VASAVNEVIAEARSASLGGLPPTSETTMKPDSHGAARSVSTSAGDSWTRVRVERLVMDGAEQQARGRVVVARLRVVRL
jgi:hypothetical protein